MRAHLMTIGQLARRSGITPRAIRHYERLGLLTVPVRSESNYRLFDSDSANRLNFITNCRSLGFSIPEIKALLRIADDSDHTCRQIEDLTDRHLEIIDSKLKELVETRLTLAKWLHLCTGKEVPECRVLDLLKMTPSAALRPRRRSGGLTSLPEARASSRGSSAPRIGS